jgi:hypothetical protein
MNPPFSLINVGSMQSSLEGWELSSGNRTQNRAAGLLRIMLYPIFAIAVFLFG